MKWIRDYILENMSFIKWAVVVAMFVIAFCFASCAQKTYEASEVHCSLDSMVLKTYFNNSFVWRDSTVIVLNEAGDTVKHLQKTFGTSTKEKLVYKDKYKYINKTKTITVTKTKKYIPVWLVITGIISLIINILFIVFWLKKMGFY